MSPAKATRPGFRQSIGSTVSDGSKPEVPPINLFHPVYHSFTNHVGSRIDVDRIWPIQLRDEDTEDLIDLFSAPPEFIDRLAPVSVQLGDRIVHGRNWTELMIKVYRQSLGLFDHIGRFIESRMRQGRTGLHKIPFTSLAVDPDTLHRIVEMDYETGDSTYNALMEQFSNGTVAPCVTTPFHCLLPLLGESEIRLCARITFKFYDRIVKKYHAFLKRNNEDGLMVLPIWIPECAYHERIASIMREEFETYCKRERLGQPHLVFLLDCDQTEDIDHDIVMKSWNILKSNGNGAEGKPRRRRRKGAAGLHDGVNGTSVVFRDRNFSDWVAYANPSVKKLLDRTIAKVDSDLNKQDVHYGWAHFEELEAIAFSSKSITNFRQKLVKLTELGYVPLSPDFYVRGKLRGQLGYAESEPRNIKVRDNSAGPDWLENSQTFTRWRGMRSVDGNGKTAVAADREYKRNTRDGDIKEEGSQCWKLAWSLVRDKCVRSVTGDLETCKGGMAAVLASFVGAKGAGESCERVQDFLAAYTLVYWREHFIQHNLSEADINIHELANKHLRSPKARELSEADASICGAAAQAIFFCLDSGRTSGTRCENFDQRAIYQNVVMLTLALCNTAYIHHWLKDSRRARRSVDLIKTELIDFESSYERHKLAQLGVKRKDWELAIASHVAESNENVVKRASQRVAAVHLRPLGFTRDFSREDELKTVNVGHIWTDDIDNLNFKYENRLFCGVNEA